MFNIVCFSGEECGILLIILHMLSWSLTLASEAWAEGYSSCSVCLSVCVSVCLRHYSKTAGSYDFLLSEIAFLHTRKNLG